MTDLCAMLGRPFQVQDWVCHAPSEPHFTCSDDGKTAQYHWSRHGLRVHTGFRGTDEAATAIELSLHDHDGGAPWAGTLPGGLTPCMDRSAVQAQFGTPVATFDNPDEHISPFPYPSMTYELAQGARMTVFFRLGRMFGITLQ